MANALIKVDFEKAFQQANELDEIAANLDNLQKTDLADCMAEVSRNWTGDHADNYIKKGAKTRNDINETARDLKNVANAIREMAKRYKKAEEDAEKIANIRTYRN